MKKSSKSLIVTLGILLFGIVVTIILVNAHPTVKPVPITSHKPFVRTQQVYPAEHQVFVDAQGTVAPRTQSLVVSQVGGQITHVSGQFVVGGFFKKGQVMLTVDTSDYVLARSRAQLQVAQARLALAREQQEAKIARSEWEKVGEGTADNLVLHKPQLEQARAALNAAVATLNQARLDIRRTQIRAPYYCRVRSKQVDEGQVINRGSPLAMVYAVDYAEVRLPLPDNDLAFIDIPQLNAARSTLPDVQIHTSFAGKYFSWKAKLVRMEGEIDQRSRMVHVVARVKEPYAISGNRKPPLAVGMFVNATISGKSFNNVFEVNRSALRNGNQILVIDAEQKLHFRKVRILRLENESALVDSGLASGERVCITPLDLVVEGMGVRTSPEKKAPEAGK